MTTSKNSFGQKLKQIRKAKNGLIVCFYVDDMAITRFIPCN